MLTGETPHSAEFLLLIRGCFYDKFGCIYHGYAKTWVHFRYPVHMFGLDVVVLLFYVHGKHLRSCRDGFGMENGDQIQDVLVWEKKNPGYFVLM